ncbi:MarR family winged helix-turn-helix transcriptional regulator [Actinacidiphila guanduensis]|uniref:DNA-binding transcriptional regulator, MarR family n=1 Tax=Actinacidiphila guanduensis TaxID=310781 RepID=A0A1H0B557_9ACTN|nr:MarR family transcriptional regulator [Actinacidiphila guanduensis]SDN40752.1 DNA-binding transcriptional regulator, MarR family [Actinacidiphila guanduensis]
MTYAPDADSGSDSAPDADPGAGQQEAAPQWLAEDQRTVWLGLVRLLATLPAALDAQLGRDAGLTFFEYSVMAFLSERPEVTLRMSELARLTNASQSRLSNVVKRLEQRGLVRRVPCPDDGRSTLAVLTEEGLRTVVEVAPRHVRTVRHLVVDALTPEQLAEMGAAHESILRRLDPGARTDPRRLDRPGT